MSSGESWGRSFTSAAATHAASSIGLAVCDSDQVSFALRKRLLVPRWWLVGTFCLGHRVGSKGDGLFEAFASERLGHVVYAASAISPRTLFCLANFWHAVCRSFLAAQDESAASVHPSRTITVPLSELFRGTVSERESAFADFRRAIMAPFEALQIVRSEKSRTQGQIILRPTGAATTLIRNLSFADDQTLTVEFLMPITEVMSGNACGSDAAPGFLSNRDALVSAQTVTANRDSRIVTLSPNVLKWHGDKSSMRKLHLYLYLELTKSLNRMPAGRDEKSVSNPGIGSTLAAKLSHEQAKDFFGDFVMRASGLYDHGVLGWSESLPPGRIADLMPVGACSGGGCLQLVRLSDHMIQVLRFEEAISQRLVPEASPVVGLQTQQVYPDPAPTRRLTHGESNKVNHQSHPQCGTSASHRTSRRIGGLSRFAKRERSGADQEMEYVLKLAQYYESLSPAQRSELDREMKHRTQADFRAWLGPILDRTH
jgi:hypothetical protein